MEPTALIPDRQERRRRRKEDEEMKKRTNEMQQQRDGENKRNTERTVRNIPKPRETGYSNKEGAGDERERRDEMKGGQKLFSSFIQLAKLHLYPCPPTHTFSDYMLSCRQQWKPDPSQLVA